MPNQTEQDNELRYTVYINSYGKKSKSVKDVGNFLCRALYLAFGNRFRVMDHRSQPVAFDPNDRDFGLGEG